MDLNQKKIVYLYLLSKLNAKDTNLIKKEPQHPASYLVNRPAFNINKAFDDRQNSAGNKKIFSNRFYRLTFELSVSYFSKIEIKKIVSFAKKIFEESYFIFPYYLA